jgi:uncharacterized protein
MNRNRKKKINKMLFEKFVINDQQSGSKIETWEEFPDGRLVVPVTLTRTGVFRYLYKDIFGETEHPDFPKSMFKDGIVNVYRSFDEVKNSLDSMKGMYFTNEHPDQEVTSENWQELSKGQFSTDVKIKEEKFNDYSIHYFDSFVTIIDNAVKEIIKNKIKDQISLGYKARFIYDPGTFGGMTYDLLQVGIENNHGALVKYGRAGSKVKIKSRIGDIDTIYEMENIDNIIYKEEKKYIMDLRGVKIEFKDSNSEILVQNELKTKEDEINTLKEKVKVIDNHEAKIIKLEKDLQDAKSIDIEALTELRSATISKACNYIKDSKPESFKGKSIFEIQKMTVTDHYKGKDLSGKSEQTISDLFELLDEKPGTITSTVPGTKPKISDSFDGVKPLEIKDTNTFLDSLAKDLTNAYLPVEKEAK